MRLRKPDSQKTKNKKQKDRLFVQTGYTCRLRSLSTTWTLGIEYVQSLLYFFIVEGVGRGRGTQGRPRSCQRVLLLNELMCE